MMIESKINQGDFRKVFGWKRLWKRFRRIRISDWLQFAVIALLTGVIGYGAISLLTTDVHLTLYIDGNRAGIVSSPAVVQEASDRIASSDASDRLALSKLKIRYSFGIAEGDDDLLDSDDCFSLLSNYIVHNYVEAYALCYGDTVVANLRSEEEAEQLISRLDRVLGDILLEDEESDGAQVKLDYTVETIVCEISELTDAELVYERLFASVEKEFTQGDADDDFQMREEPSNGADADGRLYAFVNDSVFLYDSFYTTDVLRNSTVSTLLSDEVLSMLEGLKLSYQTVRTETVNELIPFETVYVDSDELYVGSSQVQVSGENGMQQIVYEISYLAGKETGRVVTASSVISEPVSAVVVIGTKPYPEPIPTGTYIWPLPSNSIITSYFGWRPDPFTGIVGYHNGMDIYQPKNTPIHAMDGGEVIYAGLNGTYGLMVEIDHGQGLTTVYAHMNEIDVEVGDLVYQGQQIGKVGSTGKSTGYHLHLEVRINGTRKDPLDYLPKTK